MLEIFVKSRDHASDLRTGTVARSPLRITGTLPDGTPVDIALEDGQSLELHVEETAAPGQGA